MNVEGNVVVVSETGDQLRTERLLYRDKLKRIETDKPVFMENKNTRIDGVGMVFYLKEERVAILSRVRAKSVAR
jgi:LPS export ABC transporter protein LptC